MMLGSIIGYLSPSLPTRTKMLTLDGLDVIKAPKAGGNTFGASLDTIRLTEAAPGQVSTLEFDIDDPAGELAFADSAAVLLMDLVRDLPLFAGWVATYGLKSLGIGRQVHVTCVGVEAVLDWMYLPADVTFPAFTPGYTAMQSLVARAIQVGVALRSAAAISPGISSLDLPLGGMAGSPLVDITVKAGTLRQALESYARAYVSSFLDGNTGPAALVTVDFRFGLRVSGVTLAAGWVVNDYQDLALAPPGKSPSGTEYKLDAAGATRQVYITGGNALGTGVVGGSGKPGPTAVTSDPNSITTEYLTSAGQAYLAARGVAVTGSVGVQDTALNLIGNIGAEVRAGMEVRITDPQVGLSNAAVRMQTIAKEFLASGQEIWTINFGRPVSGAQLIRRLTRATLVQ